MTSHRSPFGIKPSHTQVFRNSPTRITCPLTRGRRWGKAMTSARSSLILILTMAFSIAARATVSVEKVAYKGWQNCYRVSNGTVEVIVTGDVGPRIIRYAFIGGQNLFKEYADQLG